MQTSKTTRKLFRNSKIRKPFASARSYSSSQNLPITKLPVRSFRQYRILKLLRPSYPKSRSRCQARTLQHSNVLFANRRISIGPASSNTLGKYTVIDQESVPYAFKNRLVTPITCLKTYSAICNCATCATTMS